jgi:hypothetical protein
MHTLIAVARHRIQDLALEGIGGVGGVGGSARGVGDVGR